MAKAERKQADTIEGGQVGEMLRTGFAQALALRLLTASLSVVIPLFATEKLGASPAGAGILVVLLWVGNALGALAAVGRLREQTLSSAVGFSILALALGGLAWGGASGLASVLTLAAGIGMGLPQPFLSGLMHLESDAGNPFRGLGVYSVGLGVGLVIGPLLAFGALSLYGFDGVFLALSTICLAGAAAAVKGTRSFAGRHRPPLPSLAVWSRLLADRAFQRPFGINFLYSMTLPIFLSYGALYSEMRFGFTPTEALLLFTVVFGMSTASRVAVVLLRPRLDRLLVVAVCLLLASFLGVGLAPSWPLFVAAMLTFSFPHAMIFPITSYYAFISSGGEHVMNSSYAFQTSSGVAELVSPAAAVLILPFVGVQGLFLVGAALALFGFVVGAPLLQRHSRFAPKPDTLLPSHNQA